MNERSTLQVYVFEDTILVENKSGRKKEFPRCDITNIQSFVLEMAKTGNLDDLLI